MTTISDRSKQRRQCIQTLKRLYKTDPKFKKAVDERVELDIAYIKREALSMLAITHPHLEFNDDKYHQT